MSIILIIVFIIFAWILFKGKIERDRIREALLQLKINAIRNPQEFIDDYMDSYKALGNVNSTELPRITTNIIIQSLEMAGYKVEYIKGNLKLMRLLHETVDEICTPIISALHFQKINKKMRKQDCTLSDNQKFHSEASICAQQECKHP